MSNVTMINFHSNVYDKSIGNDCVQSREKRKFARSKISKRCKNNVEPVNSTNEEPVQTGDIQTPVITPNDRELTETGDKSKLTLWSVIQKNSHRKKGGRRQKSRATDIGTESVTNPNFESVAHFPSLNSVDENKKCDHGILSKNKDESLQANSSEITLEALEKNDDDSLSLFQADRRDNSSWGISSLVLLGSNEQMVLQENLGEDSEDEKNHSLKMLLLGKKIIDKNMQNIDVMRFDGSYKRSKPVKWTESDTLKFYQGIEIFGCDLFLIRAFLKNAYTDKQIHNKFKLELRNSRDKLEKALRAKRNISVEHFENESGYRIDVATHFKSSDMSLDNHVTPNQFSELDIKETYESEAYLGQCMDEEKADGKKPEGLLEMFDELNDTTYLEENEKGNGFDLLSLFEE